MEFQEWYPTSLRLARAACVLVMSSVEEIKSAIASLSQEDYARLRDWLSERDWEKWDEEIEKDSAAGKLDFLVKEAVAEKSQGLLKKL